MITNPDGSEYRLVGSIQQFDPGSQDYELLNDLDAENFFLYGAPALYYEIFIQPQTVDPLYLEDRGKHWCPNPIELWGIYEPKNSGNIQSLFGIDNLDEIVIEFNYRDVLKRIGHPPKIGSRIFTVHKRESWVIIQRNDTEFKLWGQMHIQLICQRFQESTTDNSTKISQPQPDFRIN